VSTAPTRFPKLDAPPEGGTPPSRPAPVPPPGDPAGGEPASRPAFWLYAGHLVALVSISLSNVLCGLAILAAPWGLRNRPRARLLPAGSRPIVVALALYALLLVASIAASYDPLASLRSISELFTLSTLPLGLLLARGERRLRWLVDGLVAVAASVAVWGLLQLLGGGLGAIDSRIRGPFSHWMTFSGFLLVCDLLVLARLVAPPRDQPAGAAAGWAAGWRWAAAAAINLALLGSLTRGAWVALLVALVVLAVVRTPRLLAAFVPLALVFVLAAPVPLLGRVVSIFDLSDTSNYDRLCMAEAAAHMVAERPLLGLGPDQVEVRYAIYRPPSAPRYSVPHLHNSFLQLAAERGLPALAAYLAMTLAALAAAWRGFAREGRFAGPRADLWLGALLALVAFNVAGLFENNWGDTEVQRLALAVMALPFCLGARPAAPPEPPAPAPRDGA
jgi:O-antigen ligase